MRLLWCRRKGPSVRILAKCPEHYVVCTAKRIRFSGIEHIRYRSHEDLSSFGFWKQRRRARVSFGKADKLASISRGKAPSEVGDRWTLFEKRNRIIVILSYKSSIVATLKFRYSSPARKEFERHSIGSQATPWGACSAWRDSLDGRFFVD